MQNLGIQNTWFYTYKGLIYGNKPLDIQSKINNKLLIESLTKGLNVNDYVNISSDTNKRKITWQITEFYFEHTNGGENSTLWAKLFAIGFNGSFCNNCPVNQLVKENN